MADLAKPIEIEFFLGPERPIAADIAAEVKAILSAVDTAFMFPEGCIAKIYVASAEHIGTAARAVNPRAGFTNTDQISAWVDQDQLPVNVERGAPAVRQTRPQIALAVIPGAFSFRDRTTG